jgi:hypothetical protein
VSFPDWQLIMDARVKPAHDAEIAARAPHYEADGDRAIPTIKNRHPNHSKLSPARARRGWRKGGRRAS